MATRKKTVSARNKKKTVAKKRGIARPASKTSKKKKVVTKKSTKKSAKKSSNKSSNKKKVAAKKSAKKSAKKVNKVTSKKFVKQKSKPKIEVLTEPDTLLSCHICGKESNVNFEYIWTRSIWPRCCEEGMHIEDSSIKIGEVMNKAWTQSGGYGKNFSLAG